MNLIWAFNFGPEIDSVTGKPVPTNLFNYVTVGTRRFYLAEFLKLCRIGNCDLSGAVHVYNHTP